VMKAAQLAGYGFMIGASKWFLHHTITIEMLWRLAGRMVVTCTDLAPSLLSFSGLFRWHHTDGRKSVSPYRDHHIFLW